MRIGISSSPLRFAVFRMALALLDQFEAAMMAYEHPHHSGGAYFSLQYLFLVVRIAVWTKVMRWFARLLTLFQSIGRDSSLNFLKLISLLVCIPGFKLSNAAFKRAYYLSQIRLRRCAARIFSCNSITAALRRATLSISLSPFAISKADLRAVMPIGISVTMLFPPPKKALHLLGRQAAWREPNPQLQVQFVYHESVPGKSSC